MTPSIVKLLTFMVWSLVMTVIIWRVRVAFTRYRVRMSTPPTIHPPVIRFSGYDPAIQARATARHQKAATQEVARLRAKVRRRTSKAAPRPVPLKFNTGGDK